jgi:hypothetical protein
MYIRADLTVSRDKARIKSKTGLKTVESIYPFLSGLLSCFVADQDPSATPPF